MSGILFGVSVGPGDPELITLGAVKAIEECRVIAVPRTKGESSLALSIAEKVVSMSEKDIVFYDFPMSRDRNEWEMSHGKAAEDICSRLLSGESVAMLCLGDISVYSTFSYISERVKQSGYVCRWIPGVTSFCAAASVCGSPLVSGNEPLIVIPASADNFDELMEQSGTKVIMKPRVISERLRSVLESRPFFAVSDCGMPDEKIYTDINDVPERGSYFTVFIVK
ncbi:MAG: precorrin-2 C(20)-methyltransferase [Huintestinicola sp.]|uniref:precorrin-2 C(20)-methyltransferase n=1 Tax=Huintestinicola sp. TaxID=2981661 RepID=UPI003F11CB9F